MQPILHGRLQVSHERGLPSRNAIEVAESLQPLCASPRAAPCIASSTPLSSTLSATLIILAHCDMLLTFQNHRAGLRGTCCVTEALRHA